MASYRELAEREEWKKLFFHAVVILFAVLRVIYKMPGRRHRALANQRLAIEGFLFGVGLMVKINGKKGPENVLKHAEIMEVISDVGE